MPQEKMTVVSLFSGCGGSDLGAKWAGAEVIFANDNYAPAYATYEKHKNIIASDNVDLRPDDVRSIKDFPSCDILMGCYPCQSFTMGGKRSPETDERTMLYKEFLRALNSVDPKYFIVENVAGMQWLEGGRYLREQINCFSKAGYGYNISVKLLNARDYGIPQARKRIFIVGVRKDEKKYYHFPVLTHGPVSEGKVAYASHGEAIKHLPLDAPDEFYTRDKDPFSWWFMSRNRKRNWIEPSFTVVSNWRHITLHPASSCMRMTENNRHDKSKEKWDFTGEYEHLNHNPNLPILEVPRRLTWRECHVLQTLPANIEPCGTLEEKFMQIGNAVPPALMEKIVKQITCGGGLQDLPSVDCVSSDCEIKQQPPSGTVATQYGEKHLNAE